MAKPVISLTIYQVGNIVHPDGITMGIPINSKTVITPVSNTNPETSANTAMVGLNGEAPDPSISQKVYACINVNNPSNAGTTAYFTSSTVAAIIADVNS